MKPKALNAASSRCKQVGWLIGIWILSVMSLGLASGMLRLLMSAAGMTR